MWRGLAGWLAFRDLLSQPELGTQAALARPETDVGPVVKRFSSDDRRRDAPGNTTTGQPTGAVARRALALGGRAGGHHRGGLAQPTTLCRYTYRPVYAVIKTGGKQERVEEGQRVSVELLGATDGDEVSFAPVLLVDGSDRPGHPGRAFWRPGHGAGGRRGKGPEGARLRLQKQDAPAPVLGPPSALRRHRSDRDHQGGLRGVQDQGRR